MSHFRSRQKYSEHDIKRPSAHQPQVKTISVFIDNLDNHIANSYQRLRSRERGTPQIKNYPGGDAMKKMEDTILKDNSTTFDQASKLMYTSEKKQRSEIDSLLQFSKYEEDNIVLLDNEEVNEYIHMVYEMYNIPDPLEGMSSNTQKISIQGSRRTMTGTPILKKKASASSFRDKIVQQRQINLQQFHSNRKAEKQQEIDVSLLSERSRGNAIKKPKLKVIKLKNQDAIPHTQPLNNKQLSKSSSGISSHFTSQTFRYCFACDATVLQANLKYHEKQCEPLQRTMGNSIQEVIAILDRKIDYLTREVQKKFIQTQNDSFLKQYRSMKKSIGEWISDIKSINQENYQPNSARKKMNNIQQNWGRTVSSHFQSLSRLHWFSRLRQNIKTTYKL